MFGKKGTDPSRPTLLFLLCTGGNEFDLLPLAKEIDKVAIVLVSVGTSQKMEC